MTLELKVRPETSGIITPFRGKGVEAQEDCLPAGRQGVTKVLKKKFGVTRVTRVPGVLKKKFRVTRVNQSD